MLTLLAWYLPIGLTALVILGITDVVVTLQQDPTILRSSEQDLEEVKDRLAADPEHSPWKDRLSVITFCLTLTGWLLIWPITLVVWYRVYVRGSTMTFKLMRASQP